VRKDVREEGQGTRFADVCAPNKAVVITSRGVGSAFGLRHHRGISVWHEDTKLKGGMLEG
jgi:hypothetical protein